MKIMLRCTGRFRWACVLLPVFLADCASAASDTPAGGAPASRTRTFSVVNLAPGTGVALLNQRGQAAFATYSAGATINGFFDGRRVHRVGADGGGEALVSGLNDLGVVVGQFNDRAFTWTVAGGLRALPGPGSAIARAINDRNQAVGSTKGMAFYGRAYRWNPDGTSIELGPLPASLSEAIAINDRGLAVGYADVALHDSHAVVWDANGRATDLGTLGGTQSIAQYVNAHDQVVGTYYRDGISGGFLWARDGGLVKIVPDGQAGVRVTALNDDGEVAGNLQIASDDFRYKPFIWSTKRGRRALPLAGADHGSVDALNNRNDMVGFIEHTSSGPLGRRAVRWQGLANPVDLNSLLYHAPTGLVLYAGKAINDDGDILADSNAGLVLLRPGTQGSDAPVLGPIDSAIANDTIAVNAKVDFTVAFIDSSPSDTHAASASVDDSCAQDAPVLREVRGNGAVAIQHMFCRSGSFTIKVKVTDRAGNATEVHRLVSVVDMPAAPLPAR